MISSSKTVVDKFYQSFDEFKTAAPASTQQV